MSQILSVDDLVQLKEIILEELNIANNQSDSDSLQRLFQGFAAKRGDFSLFEEQLIRKIITGTENGKLPSEQLRELIIKNNYANNSSNQSVETKRNAVGSIYLNQNENPAILLTVDRKNIRFKKSKIKYTFDINFTEFVVAVDNRNQLIDELRDQIETLRIQIATLESDKNNIRTSIVSVELDNQDLRKTIEELQFSLDETASELQVMELEKQDELIKIQNEAQMLIQDANVLVLQKQSEYDDFKRKVETIFIASDTYDEIVDNFRKIGIGL